MITRLRVTGFKNLVDVDVRFGPFTCIAGSNGVGKSNLFDAITFLSALADHDLTTAASRVRDPEGRSGELRTLFSRAGSYHRANRMSFEAEMLVPSNARDDLNQHATASITQLRYRLVLGFEAGDQVIHADRLVVEHESLTYENIGNAKSFLPFLAEGWSRSKAWRASAITGRRTSPFISTGEEGEIIHRHQEGNQGRTQQFLARELPRTVLSTINALEGPTAVVARREMRSWALLHFEPSALRRPDSFRDPAHMTPEGRHLPATLYRIAHRSPDGSEAVYQRVANRLAQLVNDIRSVRIERDETRELLTLIVRDHNETDYAARALSDGTLRFLALTVLQEDPEAVGVWCLEEPENGLYPSRIPTMIGLLQDMATETTEALDEDNPLRQVIVNTHAPSVVQQIPEDSLVIARSVEAVLDDGQRMNTVQFSALSKTWRTTHAKPPAPILSKGYLLDYLVPESIPAGDGMPEQSISRVIDRPDVQQLRFDFGAVDFGAVE